MRANEAGRGDSTGLREPLQTIKEDLGQLGQDVAEAGRVAVQSGRDLVSDSARKVGDQARGAYDRICDFTTSRPGTSLLVALGVGAVLGMILLRRR